VCNANSNIDGNINACSAINPNPDISPNISVNTDTNCQPCFNQSSGCSGLAEN
jgi:hypothetical protein